MGEVQTCCSAASTLPSSPRDLQDATDQLDHSKELLGKWAQGGLDGNAITIEIYDKLADIAI